jgi:NAD(P)-dependent dehydrogenase (short-subunit alcohol dehydrogenase family)
VTSLAGRVALVTGASRGIGAAAAEALAAGGAQVIRVARTLTAGDHAGFHDISCDLTDAAQVEQLAARVFGELGTPEIVVSNAGGFLLKPLEQTTPAEFDEQTSANLRSSFLVARAFLPAMRAGTGGRFVSVGSVADHVGFPENAAYAASKYGLRGLHETLLAEFSGTRVRLTLVSPGPVDTSIWDPFDPDRREGLPPRAAMLRPSDVSDAILFVVTRPPHVHIDWLRLGPAYGLTADERSTADERG